MPRAAWALAVLILVAVVLRAAAALAVDVPWIAPDEMIYGLLGRGLWEHGSLDILGGPTPFYSVLYPALVGLPLRLFGLDTGYDVLRVVQAAVLCATAVPVYLWTRSLAREAWALAAAALTLALPGLVYAGMLMTEVLFLPLATLATWLMARALETPNRGRQAVLLGALAACALTRLEANVLVGALVLAALATRRVRALWPTWAVLGVVLLAWLGAHGLSPRRSLGGYEGAATHYAVGDAAKFVLYHGVDVLLAAGIVPVCAAALLALARPREERLRAAVAVAWSTAAVSVVEVGVFASAHAERLTERTLLFALPPFFVCFAAWLERGLPRPRVASAVVACAAVAALAGWPIGFLTALEALQDNPTLVPLVDTHSLATRPVLAAVGAGFALLFLLAPRRAAWILPAVVCAALAGVSVETSRAYADESEARQAKLVGPAPHWIDRAVGAPVTFLYDGDPYWNLVWGETFWNERVTAVVDVAGASVPGPLPQRELRIVAPDGVLRLDGGAVVRARYVAASSWLTFRGSRVATTPLVGSPSPALVLWRLDGTPRLDTWIEGMQPNGDVYNRASLTVYDCGAGTFELEGFAKNDGEDLTLLRNGRVADRQHLDYGQGWHVRLPTPPSPSPRSCRFEIFGTGTIGTLRFRWVRGG
jgi:hypothetical protein